MEKEAFTEQKDNGRKKRGSCCKVLAGQRKEKEEEMEEEGQEELPVVGAAKGSPFSLLPSLFFSFLVFYFFF